MNILEAEEIKIPIGYYGRQGLTLGEVAAEDVLYLDWLAGRHFLSASLQEAIDLVVAKHRERIDQAIARGERSKVLDRPGANVSGPRPKQGRLF